MTYTIKQRYISKNRSYKTLNSIGTVLHETATPGASDEDEFRYFDSGAGGRSVSVHAFVDFDSITQTVPWNEQAWHAGGTANKNYIGIELCNYNDRDKFEEIWKRGIWLFAWLHVNVINKTIITEDTLMSHAEVSEKWGETNHTDPVAYFAKYGKTVGMFRAEVQNEINSMLGNNQPPEPERPTDTGSIAGADTGVLELQKSLNRLKIRDNNGNTLAEDGVLGRRTGEVIRKFQMAAGIVVDGIAGKQTLDAIYLILLKPLLRVGLRGIAVRYLQYRLNITIDGIFGNNTRNQVMKFQRNNGLAADGIVGNLTWNKLIN
jgi:peptidoglycan hydrolase-like protein with peptidoglycan-binding domain